MCVGGGTEVHVFLCYVCLAWFGTQCAWGVLCVCVWIRWHT